MSRGDKRCVAGLQRTAPQRAALWWPRLARTGLTLAALSLAGASGCSNAEADSRVAAKATVTGPQQVVQRIEPAPAAPASAAPPSAKPVSGVAASGAAAASQPEAAKNEPPGSAQPITSKHLEAELNRLEAELR